MTTKRELLDQIIAKLIKYCEDEKIPFHVTLKKLRTQFKTEEIAGVLDDHYSKAHENKELKEFLKFEIENNKIWENYSKPINTIGGTTSLSSTDKKMKRSRDSILKTYNFGVEC